MLGIGLIVSLTAAIAMALTPLVRGLEHIKCMSNFSPVYISLIGAYLDISNPWLKGRPCLLIEGPGQITFVAFIIFICVDSGELFWPDCTNF
jgi:hypothetical protein